ncbi:hypothetical protein D3C85_1225800 [compost metagenome]
MVEEKLSLALWHRRQACASRRALRQWQVAADLPPHRGIALALNDVQVNHLQAIPGRHCHCGLSVIGQLFHQRVRHRANRQIRQHGVAEPQHTDIQLVLARVHLTLEAAKAHQGVGQARHGRLG